jgi:hypothetical protein
MAGRRRPQDEAIAKQFGRDISPDPAPSRGRHRPRGCGRICRRLAPDAPGDPRPFMHGLRTTRRGSALPIAPRVAAGCGGRVRTTVSGSLRPAMPATAWPLVPGRSGRLVRFRPLYAGCPCVVHRSAADGRLVRFRSPGYGGGSCSAILVGFKPPSRVSSARVIEDLGQILRLLANLLV